MFGGYTGKILWVDLSARTLTEERLDEQLCRKYLGGFGLGMRLIYDHQEAGMDPLDPMSTIAFGTGPLTGTPRLSVQGS